MLLGVGLAEGGNLLSVLEVGAVVLKSYAENAGVLVDQLEHSGGACICDVVVAQVEPVKRVSLSKAQC